MRFDPPSRKAVDDDRRDQRRRQRQDAAGERLCCTKKIGYDAGRLMRPERAGAAAAGHHLVGDEEDAVPMRDLDDLPQRVRRVHAHAAGPLHERLQDHGGDLFAMLAANARRAERDRAARCRPGTSSGSKRPKNSGSRLTAIAPNVSP